MTQGKKHRKRRKPMARHAPGTAPGTLKIDPHAPQPVLHVVAFGEEELEEHERTTVEKVRSTLGRHPITWVNVDGLGDARVLEELAAIFQIHPLALEDVVNTHQRPKVDVYDSGCYIVVRMPIEGGQGETEQISLFLGRGYVVTFQERTGDCFEPVRARIRAGRVRLRTGGADYLAYALLDAVLDAYFPLVDGFQDRLEAMEMEIVERPEESVVHRLHSVRREIEPHRRVARSLRDLFGYLVREEVPYIQPSTEVFLRDCLDHAIVLIDAFEGLKESASGLVDLYMTSVSNRMNEVMKVLTIMATIFIPMTFIAGIYGMNFDPSVSPFNMPELGWYWGYLYAWGLMIGVPVLMLLYFRRKGWIGGRRRSAEAGGAGGSDGPATGSVSEPPSTVSDPPATGATAGAPGPRSTRRTYS